jgi:predicted oxidoreductase
MSPITKVRIPQTELDVSRLAYGTTSLATWDLSPVTPKEIRKGIQIVEAALENGITFFDHADIYAYGKCEEVFSAVWEAIPDAREQMVLQSKCGIRLFEGGEETRYDFSYERIVSSAEGSLRRLKVEQLDLLLLHRPDPLVEPDEVARAFALLKTRGMVRHFGVSNHSASQIALLQGSLDEPLVANQLKLSLLHNSLISDGLSINQTGVAQSPGVSGLLDYCRLHGLQVQAWSPAAQGHIVSPPDDAPDTTLEAKRLVGEIAAKKGCPEDAIALAWLLHHPANIMPIIGTSRPARLESSVAADSVELTNDEWARLLSAARGKKFL